MDVDALLLLTSASHSPLKLARPKSKATVYYGFGDASGDGFGATIQIGSQIHFQYGQWTTQVSEEESSNWRELGNLTEALEDQVLRHGLHDCEIFLFTDNTTAEAAFWKGTSRSKKLFELVLRLRKLEMKANLLLHVIHISGTRMIAQGTDGLSRGDHSAGVMQGRSIAQFVPLHLSAFDRMPTLRPWVESLFTSIPFKFLQPHDWYTSAHSFGNFVWCPPPAAADVVVEQLGKARHKRSSCLHLVVLPRLMTGLWRRHLTREADCYFRIKASALWPAAQHEPLLIFVCLPFHSYSPNFAAREALLENFRRTLLAPGLWETHPERGGSLLREFLEHARGLCPL
jgi:hypothetical protein